jgi:hypothetical protein
VKINERSRQCLWTCRKEVVNLSLGWNQGHWWLSGRTFAITRSRGAILHCQNARLRDSGALPGYPTCGVTFGSRSRPTGSPSFAAMRTRNRQQVLDRQVRRRIDKQHPNTASLPLRCAVVPSCPRRRSIGVPFLAVFHHWSE